MSPTAKSAIFVLFLVNVLLVSSQDIATKFSDRKIDPNIIPKAPTSLAKVSALLPKYFNFVARVFRQHFPIF